MNKYIIIAGDLNINLFSNSCPRVNSFVFNLQSQLFLPVITKPTRFPCYSVVLSPAASLLDHLWINWAQPVSGGILCSNLSDHWPTFLFVHQIANVDKNIIY